MNTALWTVQILLAVAFAAAGCMKVFAYQKYKAMSEKKGPTNLGRGLVGVIGLAEIAGALALVMGRAAHVGPWLSVGGAIGLATVMLLAVVFHVRRHESPAAPAVLLLLTLFVVVGRFADRA